jgi:ATP-binding cassette subfamily F protein uup
MALIALADAHLAYGHLALLDGASLALEGGERVGLIGRNGAGKSSLLKVLARLEPLDDGLLQTQQNLRVVYVAQEPAFDLDASVFDIASEGVAEAKALRARYESHANEAGAPEGARGEGLDALQTRIEALGGWNWEQRVATVLHRLALDGTRRIADLSGGLTKRVALARALVAAPDVLLLDEPTNHLDLDAIRGLEQWLREDFRGALIVVTHDRAFLDAVATRIVELDRGALRSHPGDFSAFEARRAAALAAEASAFARADKLLAQEEAWVRQGVEARRTRSVGRVARLERLREQREARRAALGRVRLDLDAGAASGKLVAVLEHAGKSFGAQRVIDDFSATLLRGDKVGVIGPNGSGKTTLLRLILGEIEPDRGTVRRGTRLAVAYFDQMREALDPEATLADTISPGSEWIEMGSGSNKTSKHVMSYLGDFLFAPARAHAPVKSLSGGERNRLLLARLFARPANVLVLDEPTNDLDIDTLELLEDLLQAYAGTVFLVSHDRRFLDAVVTSTIVNEGAGLWREYEGGVADWLQQSARRASESAPAAAKPAPPRRPADAAASARRKLGFNEQRELDVLPARVEALEAEQRALGEELAGSRLYTETPQRVAEVQARHAAIEDELMALLERWQSLSDRAR